MRRHERRKLTAIGALLTCGWLAVGTTGFMRWQNAESPGLTAKQTLWPALEAAILTALVFWVVVGILFGLIRWIVTGRGPQA